MNESHCQKANSGGLSMETSFWSSTGGNTYSECHWQFMALLQKEKPIHTVTSGFWPSPVGKPLQTVTGGLWPSPGGKTSSDCHSQFLGLWQDTGEL